MNIAQTGLPDAEHLVNAISQGDKKAESAFVERFYRGLLLIMHKRTDDYSLAQDIVQDAFIIVIQKIRRNEIQKPASIQSFLKQTAINLFIDRTRKEKRRNTFVDSDIDFSNAIEQTDITYALHLSKTQEITRNVIAELKVERDRELLVQYFFYEKDKKAICNDLSLSPEHFDRVLYRVRQRLKAQIIKKLKLSSTSKQTLLALTFLSFLSMFLLFDEFLMRETGDTQHLRARNVVNPDTVLVKNSALFQTYGRLGVRYEQSI